MRAALADLDSLAVSLSSEAAAEMAARRALWDGMTTRQRRRMAKAAVKEFQTWLQDQPRTIQGQHGRRQHPRAYA